MFSQSTRTHKSLFRTRKGYALQERPILCMFITIIHRRTDKVTQARHSFLSVMHPDLLPPPRNPVLVRRLRHARTFLALTNRTKKYHSQQGRIKTLGAPCQRVMGALSFPPLPFPLQPFHFRFPSPSCRPILCPISPLLSVRSGHLNTAMGLGKHCKLPSGV